MKITQVLSEKSSAKRKANRDIKFGRVPGKEQPNTAGAGAFGNIANTLTPDPKAPSASSTGGVTTPTDTGLTHAASPTNLNQPKPEVPAETPAAEPAAPAADQALPDAGLGQHSDGTYIQPGDKFDAGNGKALAAPTSVGQKVGGAVQGIKNAWNDAKAGYQAGKSQATPPGQPATAPAASAPRQAGGGAAAPGGGAIAQINTRLDRVEQALGIAEGKVFHSKFLGIDI